MAESRWFECTHCNESVESWSDGNPYYLDENGKKQYAYHPDHAALARCIGNDSPHICLACGHQFKVDSRKPISKCRKCKSENTLDTWELDGQPCPWCREGRIRLNDEIRGIS